MKRSEIQEQKKNEVEDQIGEELVRAIPGLPKMLLQMAARIERFDNRQPQTELAAFKDSVASMIAKMAKKEGVIIRLFRRHLQSPAVAASIFQHSLDVAIHYAKQGAAADARYSLLLKLMEEADQTVPFISVIVPLRHGDPEGSLVAQCRPLPDLEEARRSKGEARANAVLNALLKTAEGLYRPYLITLRQLSYLKEGKLPPNPGEFGDLVTVTSQRLATYPGLVDSDAGWLRNSTAHLNNKYVVGKDALLMWDRKHPEILMPVIELMDRVERMYQISSQTIQRVGQLYALRNFFLGTGLLDEFVA